MLRDKEFAGKEVTLEEVLQNKERRSSLQRVALSGGPASLISFSLNIPGPVKQFPLAQKAFGAGEAALYDVFGDGLSRVSVSRDVTGPEAIYACTLPPREAKAKTAAIEDGHPLGRLFDMDILSPDGEHLSRTELGSPARKCLLCGNDARVCGRSRTHTVPEMQEKIAGILEGYFLPVSARACADAVQKAMLYELAVTPKPGLVDLRDNGAHADMDVFTFINSAVSLRDCFINMYSLGRQNADASAEDLFRLLRENGKEAEKAMLSATDGANTHKGFLFSAGILCGALGALQTGTDRQVSETELRKRAAAIGQCSLGDLAGDAPPLPYRLTGMKGAREEAALGFPAVFERGLPMLKQTLAGTHSLRFAAAKTLLSLIAAVGDSNIVRRAGRDEAEYRKAQAGALLTAVSENDMDDVLSRLNEEYIRASISPGGCADLLALSILLMLWEKTGTVREGS